VIVFVCWCIFVFNITLTKPSYSRAETIKKRAGVGRLDGATGEWVEAKRIWEAEGCQLGPR
jgi:hypothetical protein